MEAASAWVAAGRSTGRDETDDDLAAWRAPDEIRDRAREDAPGGFPVIEDNWATVAAWMAVQTQFTRTGFRYEGIEAGLRMAAIDCTPQLFENLRIMEAAALEALSETQ